ncbi:DUF4157 domain-containing protein [Nostoc sp. LEGE 06077]|nr:DUF4157 domain-containing protein [Nostoc sp. LEGE 06077]
MSILRPDEIPVPVTPRLQMKLSIREPREEQETTLDQPLNTPVQPLIQRVNIGGIAASPDVETGIQRARGSGQPLADSIREPMEQAFGADFSSVRIHADSQADQLNQSIQAKAFTTGQDVFFRQGAYKPGSRGGQELLAHELTHVVQQESGNVMQSKLELDQKEPTEEAIQEEEGKTINKTGLPNNLKADVENLSGYSLDNVRVHYNAQLKPQRKLNNVIVQRVLAVTNLEDEIDAVVQLIDLINNTIFKGKYIVSTIKSGENTLLTLKNGKDKEIGETSERFYNMFKKMIESHHFAFVRLVYGDARFPIASFNNQAIDVRDISGFGGSTMRGTNAAGILIHELWEQYNAQVGEMEYEKAHNTGIEAENYVQGNKRIFDYPRRVSERQIEEEREEVFVHFEQKTPEEEEVILSQVHILKNQVLSVHRVLATNVFRRVLSSKLPVLLNTEGLEMLLKSIAKDSPNFLIDMSEMAIREQQ